MVESVLGICWRAMAKHVHRWSHRFCCTLYSLLKIALNSVYLPLPWSLSSVKSPNHSIQMCFQGFRFAFACDSDSQVQIDSQSTLSKSAVPTLSQLCVPSFTYSLPFHGMTKSPEIVDSALRLGHLHSHGGRSEAH